MIKPILSICIPTYNRAKYLQKLLDSIVLQKVFIETNKIEIVIDDGPSQDNTTELIKQYQEIYGDKIKYFRNNIAVGMCPAFLEAISFSGGIYTWLFGSDDLMTDGSLDYVLKLINNEEPSLILSDRYVFSNDDEITGINFDSQQGDVLLNGAHEFFSFLGNDNKVNGTLNSNYFTFISIFCFKQDFFNKNKNLFLEEFGKVYNKLNYNYFNFALIPYFNIWNEKIAIIRSKTLVLARGGNHGWTFSSMDIFNDLYFMIKILRKKYHIPHKCNMFFNEMLLGRFLPSIMGLIKKNGMLKYLYRPLTQLYYIINKPLSKLMRKI